jgi:hypothetical protein
LLKYQTINRRSLFHIHCYNNNNLSFYLYKIFFDKLIYKITAFSIFNFVFYQLNNSNAQLFYFFYFALFVLYNISVFYFIFIDVSNVAKTGVFSKDHNINIMGFYIDSDIENIFIEQEKQKLVDFLKK